MRLVTHFASQVDYSTCWVWEGVGGLRMTTHATVSDTSDEKVALLFCGEARSGMLGDL